MNLKKKIAIIGTSMALLAPITIPSTAMAGEAIKLEKGVSYKNKTGCTWIKNSTHGQYLNNNKVNKIKITNLKSFSTTNLKGKYVYITKDGKFGKSYTGVAQSCETGEWVYVKNGIYDSTFTGVAKSTTGNWVFVKNGRYNKNFTGVAKSTSGNWVYVNKGKFDATYTGVAKSINGNMLFVTDGKWNSKMNGKYYNTVYKKGYTEYQLYEYAIENGRVSFAVTTAGKLNPQTINLSDLSIAYPVEKISKYYEGTGKLREKLVYTGSSLRKYEYNEKGKLEVFSEYDKNDALIKLVRYY